VSAVLEACGLVTGYHGHPVVRGLDLAVGAGEIVALLGPNGAGKTTSLLALAGELPVLGGEVRLHGRSTSEALHRRARRGMAFVTEERSVFMGLSVADNLRCGRADLGLALGLFPELAPLLTRRAGLLSGGEQQMLTLARALARRPSLLVIDELSLGLAPLVVRRLLGVVRRTASDEGVAVLLVEQHVRQALRVADHVVVLRRGAVALRGPAGEVAGRLEEVEAAYLAEAP
jgi:ABC-type branched-subunit amino acid transport system ATPase component